MTKQASSHRPRLLTRSTRAILGEGPVWDERTQTLYWVDIERGELRHCQADGSEETSVSIGQRIGCAALRSREPGFIVGLEHSISLLTLNPVAIRPLAQIDPDLPGNRCNDGKCDREGRFWVGTCDMGGVSLTGWLIRLDAAGALARTAGPYICVNGPAFSADGRTMYCVDSYGKVVYRYALSPSGALTGERVFRRFDEPGWGSPDGLTCDVEGCIWIAHWGGSRVSRFSPDGELLDVIHFPVLQPSSCTFGGPNLTQLFVTTAAVGLDGSSNANGLAGAVFVVDLEVGGLPPARYNG